MRILSGFARITKLSAQDLGVLLGLAALECCIALALAIAPLSAVRRWIRIAKPAGRACSVSEQRVCWALDALGRRMRFAKNCLVRAFAAELLLADIAQPTRIVIGVRRSAAHLEGHAWVERGGRVIVGGVAGRAGATERPAFTPMAGWDV
jgi:hypothetical protein